MKTLELLSVPGFHERLGAQTGKLLAGMQAAADRHAVPFTTAYAGGMFGFFFTGADRVSSFDDVMACDGDSFKRFFHLMLDAGINLAPSAFEAGFMSAAHSDEDIARTIDAADAAFAAL